MPIEHLLGKEKPKSVESNLLTMRLSWSQLATPCGGANGMAFYGSARVYYQERSLTAENR